ncbi:unnamed protein product [Rotaria sp. Silwood1]|nr:unnamed protein product [Rotaria sp. Silwood1]CAF1659022.1 unnamed protein product [Rotaria sp. Silwood1]
MFIDSIVVNKMLNEDISIIDSLNYRRISCTLYRHHKIIPTRWSFIFMEISLSIIYLSFFIITNSIIQENNKKENLFLFKVLWKMSLNGWIIFEYVSYKTLLFVFIILNIRLISYSILMGQLFNSFTRLFILKIILWIILLIRFNENLSYKYEIILCINPYNSLIYILRYLFQYERTMIYVNLNKKLYQSTTFLSMIYFIIIIFSHIYWILIWYFEKIYPGHFFCLY